MRQLLAVCLLSASVFGQTAGVGLFTDTGDVGSPAIKGSTTFDASSGEYRITGAGANMWAKDDQFQYAWKQMTGNFTVNATVRFLGQGADHRKAGIVVRQSLEADATYADVVVHGNGMPSLQWRSRKGEDTNTLDLPFDGPGTFKIRLVRTGVRIFMYVGKGNADLKEIVHTEVSFQGPVLVGLGVCSHDAAVSDTAIFSNVTIEAGPAPAAPPAAPKSVLGPTPAPQMIPTPGPVTGNPYAPQTIMQGGIVVPIYPAGSSYLKADRIKEPEVYNMTGGVPGRIASIVNIHNPSVELHRVPAGMNTGAAVIVVAGGGHNTLNVGSEGADFVPFFYNYGINTVILRNRLRRDGYNAQTDAVYDMLQAIKVVRAYAEDWGIDPRRIGAIGFSAGAELTAPAAIQYVEFDKTNDVAGNKLAKVSSRPDFVGLIYPGPTPFRGGAQAAIPDDAPPAFLAGGGVGDAGHAQWADEFFSAFLRARIPNLEMHVYGNGRHPGDPLPEGGSQTGGLTDRNNIPLGTWQFRFIDWFRDLGFMQKPGVETKAERDVKTRVASPPRGRGAGGRGTAPQR